MRREREESKEDKGGNMEGQIKLGPIWGVI